MCAFSAMPEELAGPADSVAALPCCLLWLEDGSEARDVLRPLIVMTAAPSSSPEEPTLWASAAQQMIGLETEHYILAKHGHAVMLSAVAED